MDLEQKKVFAERLGILRTKQNLSQQQLAEKININRETIAKYETVKRIPSYEHLTKFAEYFHVSTDYLLGLQREPTNDPDVTAVTEYTGLTKKAVKNIVELQYPFGKILNKLFEHEKLYYYFTIMKAAFDLKHKIIKKGSQKPTDNDEEKAAQAEKILEDTPYNVAFAFDELLGYEYHLSDTIKKIIDDIFYELEKEVSDNGNHNPTNQ